MQPTLSGGDRCPSTTADSRRHFRCCFGVAWVRAIRLCGQMTRFGFHASHEQIDPPAAAARRAAGRAGRVRGGHVLGPLLAVDAAGRATAAFAWSWLGAALATTSLPFGVCQRPRPALPPGDRRAGDRHARRRCSPAGSGSRSAAARPPTSTSPATAGRDKETRTRRLEECVDVIRRAAGRRGGQPRRAGHGRPGPALGACRTRAPRLVGPAVSRGERRAGRRLGRRAGHGQPAARPAARRWSPPTATPAAAARSRCRCTSPGRRPRTRRSRIAHDQWRSNVFGAAGRLGPRDRGGVRRAVATTSRADAGPRRRCDVSADLGEHRDWLAEYAALGFDEIYLHHVGQDAGATSSTPSASTSCPTLERRPEPWCRP